MVKFGIREHQSRYHQRGSVIRMEYGITSLIIFGISIVSIIGVAVYTKVYKIKGITSTMESNQ